MMNFVGLGLIFTSIFTAAVLSPIPTNQKQNQNTEVLHVAKQGLSNHNQNTEVIHVAKQGLSVIVVQYEKDGTKISISTPQEQPQQVQQTEIVVEEEDFRNTQFHHAKEVICDAFGKCKHKMAGVFSKAKEKVVEVEEDKEAVEGVGEAISRKAHDAKECAQRTCGQTFKTAVDTGKTLEGDVRRNVSEDLDIVRRHVAEKAKEGLETVETAKAATEKVKNVVGGKAKGGLEAVESAAEAVKDNAIDAKDTVKDKAKGGLETVKDAVQDKGKEGLDAVEAGADKVKHIVQDKAKGALEKSETAAEKVKDKAKEGLETVETVADNVKHMVQDKFKHGPETDGSRLISQLRRMSDDIKTYVGTLVSSSIGSLLGVIHLLGFAMAYGMSVWITFVSSYVLAGALPRQQFGMVQSKIYPLYFRAMAYSISVALVGHILSERRNMSESEAEIFQGYNLIASLLMVLANLLYLEPRATKVMYEKLKVEKEEGSGEEINNENCTGDGGTRIREIGRLNEGLEKLNSMSSTLNILTLTSLTWHLVYLGQCLHMTACR